ncbi:MAG: hypothetical protein KA973_14235 [Candidatus Microthrix sp.]|nr:hypothetical protein [Candidatus Microthrix sp.]
MAVTVRASRLWSSQSGREALVYGTYEPTTATAGIITPEASLTAYNADVNAVTIPDGAVISGKVIYGDVTFAGSATITDCLLVGGANAIASGNVGVLKCTNARTGQAVLTDCTIRPRTESDGRDGALGWQFELYRCHITGGVDGVGIYNTGGPNANVKVKGCLIEDLAYTYPDRDHADGCHNDCIQIQGGKYIEIVGNALKGTAHYMAGSGQYFPTHASTDLGDWPLQMPTARNPGAGIIINANVTAVDSTVTIDSNYFRFCKSQLLVKSLADGFVCTGNRFSAVDTPAKNVNGTVRSGTALTFTANEYWVRFDTLSGSGSVSGLTSGDAWANTTNVWLDGPSAGQPLASPRASGIHSDAA